MMGVAPGLSLESEYKLKLNTKFEPETAPSSYS
jgi:hypothetical protein